jgi:hypothetical protein
MPNLAGPKNDHGARTVGLFRFKLGIEETHGASAVGVPIPPPHASPDVTTVFRVKGTVKCRPFHPRAAAARRGSIYTLVMGLAMLVTVVGAGLLAAARMTARAATNTNDWDEAGVLAYSAVQHAIASVNAAGAVSPTAWRSNYTSGKYAFSASLGRGTMSWVLTDEVDGNLSADYARPIRLYGVGSVGRAKRCYSILLYPAGAPLDVLRTAYHAGTGVRVQASTTSTVLNGPASTNGRLRVSGGGTCNGNVEAGSISGTVNGIVTAPAAAKPIPSASIFNTYLASATTIPTSAATGGQFSPGLVSGGPGGYVPSAWGISPDANGLYYLQLPNNGTVYINAGRYNCTLLIDAGNSSQTLIIRNEVLWQPWRSDYPALIVRGVNTVHFQGSLSPLNENPGASPTVGMNLNPPGSPYNGATNSTLSDAYPSELDGLYHVMGATSVYLDSNTYIHGTLVTDGTIYTTGASAVSNDPALTANPPKCYTKGDQVAPVPGTWNWDAPP